MIIMMLVREEILECALNRDIDMYYYYCNSCDSLEATLCLWLYQVLCFR